MAIVGVGLDVVPVERFATALRRRPGLGARLFTDAERTAPGGGPRAADSLAARFAAKEAFVKALGRPGVGAWHDVEVVTDGLGNPSLRLSGATADLPEVHRVAAWHLSLSHDGGIAAAVVIAEA